MPEFFNMAVARNARQKLFLIKTIHTAFFIFFSSCLAYVFYSGITKTYDLILVLAIGAILIEGLILLPNKWQCPLTNLARKYGDETGRVTDIFFPAWFVPHVFRSCTVLLIIGVILLVVNYAIK
jgi:hypothetical protein